VPVSDTPKTPDPKPHVPPKRPANAAAIPPALADAVSGAVEWEPRVRPGRDV
jgi:hypothetical protein